MNFQQSYIYGLPQLAVLEWFKSPSGEATSACKLVNATAKAIQAFPNVLTVQEISFDNGLLVRSDCVKYFSMSCMPRISFNCRNNKSDQKKSEKN